MGYNETVLEHFRNPRNVGKLEHPDAVGEAGNARCGDIMKLCLQITEEGVITDVRFNAYGCGAAIAAGSMTTELLLGKTLEEAKRLTNQAVVEALGGLPEEKLECSLLAEQALAAALEDYALGQEPGGQRPKRISLV